jgi:purine-binding chemotaxis protein CheW
MAHAEQFVTIGVGEELFAAPVGQVQEILELSPITRAPRAPRSLLGIIDVRGRSVPVLDLRDLLDLPGGADDEHTRIVVLSLGGPDGSRVVGLKSDRVFEVTALDEGGLDAPPGVRAGDPASVIRGIGRRRGRFVTVLDIDRLIDGELGPAADGAAA